MGRLVTGIKNVVTKTIAYIIFCNCSGKYTEKYVFELKKNNKPYVGISSGCVIKEIVLAMYFTNFD